MWCGGGVARPRLRGRGRGRNTSPRQCSGDVTSHNRVSMNGGEGVMEVGDVRERYGSVGAGRSLSVVGNSLKPLGPEPAVWSNYD